MFAGKTLLITGGTGSFGNAVLNRFLKTDIGEIRIFSRDEIGTEYEGWAVIESVMAHFLSIEPHKERIAVSNPNKFRLLFHFAIWNGWSGFDLDFFAI